MDRVFLNIEGQDHTILTARMHIYTNAQHGWGATNTDGYLFAIEGGFGFQVGAAFRFGTILDGSYIIGRLDGFNINDPRKGESGTGLMNGNNRNPERDGYVGALNWLVTAA